MENELHLQMKRINEKLQQLLKKHLGLQKENEKLKQELGQSSLRQDHLKSELDKLQQKTELLRLSKGEMNDPEKKIFEKRINGYLKEIDKCIGMLNE
jgi:chromosome segregation ATPase